MDFELVMQDYGAKINLKKKDALNIKMAIFTRETGIKEEQNFNKSIIIIIIINEQSGMDLESIFGQTPDFIQAIDIMIW